MDTERGGSVETERENAIIIAGTSVVKGMAIREEPEPGGGLARVIPQRTK